MWGLWLAVVHNFSSCHKNSTLEMGEMSPDDILEDMLI